VVCLNRLQELRLNAFPRKQKGDQTMKNTNKKENGQKFDEGVLRADGCMMRHQASRQAEFKTFEEDGPEYSFGRSAYWEERRLLNRVCELKAMGFKIRPDETLEEFVQAHEDEFTEESL